MLVLLATCGALLPAGCAHQQRQPARTELAVPPLVIVVPPVLNLSNSADWDPLKVTDILAAELQAFPNLVVVPVNRAAAALARQGKPTVQTPADALGLAREFNADATVVGAITDFEPYDPPRVGLLLQWYEPALTPAGSSPANSASPPAQPPSSADASSRAQSAPGTAPAADETADAVGPLLQVQRVVDASQRAVLDDVRAYAAERNGYASPLDWRVHTQSQELFLRYACRAVIRPMLEQRVRYRSTRTLREAAR